MATTIITKNGSGAPTADDLSVGELAVDLTNKRLYSKNSSSEVIELGVNAAADTTFGDNVKAVFGAGSDLQIYHDGTHSNIKESGAGDLQIFGDNVNIYNAAGSQNLINLTSGGANTLFHSGSAKLATTSTGIDVTGTVTADGLTVDGNIALTDSGSSNRNVLYLDGSDNLVLATGTTAGVRGIELYTNNSKSLSVAEGGDISFYEDTGTTAKLFWDASAESLGIGTSSPNDKVDISGSTGDGYRLTDGTHTGVYRSISGGTILKTTSNHALLFGTNDTERMRIDSSGNVGIGTSSPADALHVNSGTSNEVARFESTDGTAYLSIMDNTTSNSLQGIGSAGDNLTFYSNSAERMRIDSSGNLLVSKTSSSFSVAGIGLMANDQIFATATSDNSLALNRLSTDGDIAKFYKDGSTVGSIGTILGQYLSIGTGDVGFAFDDDQDKIIAWNISTNAARDAAVDLGANTQRFKDLYLSGRARAAGSTGFPAFASVTDTDTGMNPDGAGNIQFSLQGVEVARFDGDGLKMASGKGIKFDAYASGNVLDDYEEGTWTPVLEGGTSAGSGTYSFQAGNYTKVGNLVVATGRISFSSHTGTGNMWIEGLPFTASDTGQVEPACVIHGSDITLTANNYMVATVKRSDTYVEVLQTPVGGGSRTAATMDSGGSLFFTVTYQAA